MFQRLIPPATILLCLALASCVQYRAEPLTASQAMDDFETWSLDDPQLQAFIRENSSSGDSALSNTRWDLDQLTWAAIFFSPELAIARARLSAAEAGILTASVRSNPAFSMGNSFITSAEGESPWILQPSLDFTLETMGKRDHRMRQANALSEAASFELAGTAWRIRSQLRNALVDILLTEREVRFLQSEESTREELLGMIQERIAVGDLPPGMAAGATIELNRTRQLRLERKESLSNARVSLAQLIGIPSSALNDKSFLLPQLDSPTSESLFQEHIQRDALLNRLDVLRALAEYEASEAALQLEISRQYPNIVLGPGYRWRETEKRWLLGLAFDLPAVDRNQGPIAQALANRDLAAAEFNVIQSTALADLERALNSYRIAQDRYVLAEETLATLQVRENEVERAVALGDTDRSTLAGIQLVTAVAHRDRVTALRILQQALGRLEDAVQKPLDGSSTLPPVPDVSSSRVISLP